MASSTSVMAAELISLRTRWKTVADRVTIMTPAAAHVTSHGRIRVRPGNVSPTPASTSATPRKSWNHRGSDAFICAAISGGGERKSQPWAKNATASSTCTTQSVMFMTSPFERGRFGARFHVRSLLDVTRRTRLLFPFAAALIVVPTLVSGQRGSRDARPDFEGIWNSATVTPIERPAQLKDKPFFTPEEAAAWERQAAERNEEPPPTAKRTGTGTYNAFYREWGTRTVKTLRTSIVTEPPDGRIPALTPAAAEIKRRRIERLKKGENPEDLGLQDQCVAFLTAGPPMLPYSYNSNYQIVQTRDAVVIHAEMIHDARIIHLDGRPHLSPRMRLPMGDSIGRWEGNTLVIDTTNFDDGGGFYGDAGGNFGWDRNLHLVERLRLFDGDTLLYQFEIDNPSAFTQPWKGELTMTRSSERIYEFACHEGNYSLTNMLRGYRLDDRKPSGAAPR